MPLYHYFALPDMQRRYVVATVIERVAVQKPTGGLSSPARKYYRDLTGANAHGQRWRAGAEVQRPQLSDAARRRLSGVFSAHRGPVLLPACGTAEAYEYICGLMQWGGRLPSAAASRFSAAMTAISPRVSRVALPTCGSSTTLGKSASPGVN